MVQYTSYICKFDNRYFDEELKDSRYNGGFMRKTAGVENGSFGIWIISAVRLMGIREAKATIKNIIKSY